MGLSQTPPPWGNTILNVLIPYQTPKHACILFIRCLYTQVCIVFIIYIRLFQLENRRGYATIIKLAISQVAFVGNMFSLMEDENH